MVVLHGPPKCRSTMSSHLHTSAPSGYRDTHETENCVCPTAFGLCCLVWLYKQCMELHCSMACSTQSLLKCRRYLLEIQILGGEDLTMFHILYRDIFLRGFTEFCFLVFFFESNISWNETACGCWNIWWRFEDVLKVPFE